MTIRAISILSIAMTATLPCQAIAGDIDVGSLVSKACSRADLVETDKPVWIDGVAPKGKVAVPLPNNRLFAFLLADSGLLESEGGAAAQLNRQIKLNANLQGQEFDTLWGKRSGEIVSDVELLQAQLSTDKLEDIKVIKLNKSLIAEWQNKPRHWVLDDAVRFACIYDQETDDVKPKANGLVSIVKSFRLRETTEALGLVNEARKAAPSANLSYKRERTFADDGTPKRTATFAFKGVLGFPFLESDFDTLTAYAGYELNRARVRPAPALTAPATQRDDDTEIFKTGFYARHVFGVGEKFTSTLDVDVAYLNDYVKNSKRLRMKVGMTPNFEQELGFCAVGRMNSPRKNFLGIQGKCTAQLLGEINHITKLGGLSLKPKDEFILLGARVAADFQFSENLDHGLIGGLEYRYLETVHGAAPDLDRFKAYFKYRFWLKDAAVDVGFEYIDGTNPDSFTDDNSLMLTVGLML
jgi:hypothetical protein